MPRLLDTLQLRVLYDYGQFSLIGSQAVVFDGDLLMRLIEQGVVEGIAVAPGDIWISSPHQNNFDSRFTRELWDADPPYDTSWEEVSEATLEIDDECGGILFSPTMDQVALEVPASTYAVRVLGRGFVARGWPGSTKPGDEWLLQLWPGEAPTRRVKGWEPSLVATDSLAGLLSDEQIAGLTSRARHYWNHVRAGHEISLLGPEEWMPAWEDFITAVEATRNSGEFNGVLEPPKELLDQLRSAIEASPAPRFRPRGNQAPRAC